MFLFFFKEKEKKDSKPFKCWGHPSNLKETVTHFLNKERNFTRTQNLPAKVVFNWLLKNKTKKQIRLEMLQERTVTVLLPSGKRRGPCQLRGRLRRRPSLITPPWDEARWQNATFLSSLLEVDPPPLPRNDKRSANLLRSHSPRVPSESVHSWIWLTTRIHHFHSHCQNNEPKAYFASLYIIIIYIQCTFWIAKGSIIENKYCDG